MLCDDLDGWDEELMEVQEGREVCALIVDSYCCTGGSEVKASVSNAGDPGSIPGSGRSN